MRRYSGSLEGGRSDRAGHAGLLVHRLLGEVQVPVGHVVTLHVPL